MSRVLVLIILLVVSFLVIRFFKQKQETQRLIKIKKKKTDTMVKCQVCGLHIPVKEATINRGNYYCCLEHANQDTLPPTH